jgi:hypothetical protein
MDNGIIGDDGRVILAHLSVVMTVTRDVGTAPAFGLGHSSLNSPIHKKKINKISTCKKTIFPIFFSIDYE